MNIEFSGNPKPFGIIGLVLAIFSLLFSLIPCVGFYAIIPSFMAVIFCVIAFLYLKQQNESTSVPLAGLIIGVVAIAIGGYQYYKYKAVYDSKAKIEHAVQDIEHEIGTEIKNQILEDIQTQIEGDSIQKIESDTISS